MLSVAFYITVMLNVIMLSVVMLLPSVVAPSFIRLESNMKKKFYNLKLGRQQQNLPGRVPGHDVPIRRPAGVSALKPFS
jgi:hypothetical protein